MCYRIDDCVKLHIRAPEEPYTFPSPPVFGDQLKPIPYDERLQTFFNKIGKQAPTVSNYSSSVLDPHVLDGESQMSGKSKIVSPALSSSDPSKLVFSGKAVYISTNCELSPEKLQTFVRKIKEAGGEALAGANIQENAVLLDRADVAVINYREGWEFWRVSIIRLYVTVFPDTKLILPVCTILTGLRRRKDHWKLGLAD